MDKILTIRQPYASALVHGIKRAEYRSWRIKPGDRVWIHAGLIPGMPLSAVPAWLRGLGEDCAADYIDWTLATDPVSRPDLASTLAQSIYACKGLPGEYEFPFGVIIGWCVFGDAVPTTGDECKFGRFANPVEQFHTLAPGEWKIHKGAQGLLPFKGL